VARRIIFGIGSYNNMIHIQPNVEAYFSKDSQSWVRMEKCEDGEYSHLSGYPTRMCALLNCFEAYSEKPLPRFLTEENQE